ncbi:phosphorelay protein [Colwellia sp. E2M01]|uniref:phosphorelay protein n=1 Tax=Colwellia sp. E2M01 TaxID=2841561 RepID=UPI002091E54B|nr:phosphorelay protein [Colwellia sp. E2M01]
MEIEQLSAYLDEVLLADYLDRLGKNIIEQMFALYSQQVVIYLNDIEKAQQVDSKTDWQTSCHKMKGATASVGMRKLHLQLKTLEKINATQQEKSVMLADLKALNEASTLAFNTWLASI